MRCSGRSKKCTVNAGRTLAHLLVFYGFVGAFIATKSRRLRQSSPFCGILSTAERWEIYRRFSGEHQAA